MTIAGEKIHVGMKGLKGNTPKGLKTAYRIMMGVTAIWAIVQPQFPEIPEHFASVVNRLCLIAGPVFYGVAQMFGYAKPDGE